MLFINHVQYYTDQLKPKYDHLFNTWFINNKIIMYEWWLLLFRTKLTFLQFKYTYIENDNLILSMFAHLTLEDFAYVTLLREKWFMV